MGIFDTRQNLTCRGFYQTSGETLTLSGNTKIASVGSLQYCTDQSSKYNARSIPDVAFVTGRTTSANNGLTKLGNNVVLGGNLTGNTSLSGNYTLNINGNAKLNTTCGYQISGVTMFDVTRNSLTNISIGRCALVNNTTGCNNVAIGDYVLTANTSGINNIGIGCRSLVLNLCHNNVSIGNNSMINNISGNSNTAIGSSSLQNNISGKFNLAIGFATLTKNTVGCNNIGIGNGLTCNISGNFNIGIGKYAGYSNLIGSTNIFIGNCAGYGELGSGKLYIGSGATSLIMGDMAQDCIILPKLKLRTTPDIGNTSDSILVRNSTDCLVKTISASSITGNSIISANNGLTKLGNNVVLGGALTGNTSLTGNYTLNFCNNAKLNTTCGYQISGVTMFTTKNSLSNIAIGQNILNNNTSGLENVGIGQYTLSANTIGCYNFAIGTCSLKSNSSGCNNIAIGRCILIDNTIGFNNIGIGQYSIVKNTIGDNNIGIGANALRYNIVGTKNIAIGYIALGLNTSGNTNLAIGVCSLGKNTIGSINIGIGCKAGCNNISGNKNIFIGDSAGINETGSGKLYIGSGATSLIMGDMAQNCVILPKLKLRTTPDIGSISDSILVRNSTDCLVKSISISSITGNSIVTANNGLTKVGNNVVLGGALTGNTSLTGNYTLNINSGAKLNSNCGYQISGVTMFDVTRNSLSNIGIGQNTLVNNTTGLYNIGIGLNALSANTKGCYNVGIGLCALSKNNCNGNIAIGECTLYKNINSFNQIAIGRCALLNNTGGTFNIGLGAFSLADVSGSSNIAIGTSALQCVHGIGNIGIGSYTGRFGQNSYYNIGIGWRSNYCGGGISCSNVYLGAFSGYYNSGSTNIFIGYNIGYNCKNETGKILIGSGDTATIMGDIAQDCVILPKLKLRTAPTGSGGYLCYDPLTCLVCQTSGGSGGGGGITSVANGLSLSGNNIVLGGSLTGNTIIDLNNKNFEISNSYIGFNSGTGFNEYVVSSIELQSDEKILVGGSFTTYNGVTANYIIRLNQDGSIDNTFNSGAGFNHIVQSIQLQSDGKILVGGVFTSYSGVTANRIIRLNSDGSIDSTFNIDSGFDYIIQTIELQTDGKILVGGGFTTYSGVTANRIIRLNSDGSIDNTFNSGDGFNGYVYTLQLQSDGKILVGGSFTTYSGVTANYVIRLNQDGSIDNTFNSGAGFNNYINNIKQQLDGKILIGGGFTTYSGVTANSIIRLNSNGSIDSTFNTGSGFDSDIQTIELQSDDKILVGGYFTSYFETTTNNIIRLNSDGSIDDTFNSGSGFDSGVWSIKQLLDGKILIGGGFTTYNEITANRIIRLNSNGSIDNNRNNIFIFNGKVAEYNEDYSQYYTARLIPDVAFVTGRTSTSGDSNNIYSTTIVSGNTTLTTGSSYVILVNSPTSIVTVTLPLTPTNGEVFKIKDASGKALTYNITIDGNGRNIDGSSSALINTDYGAVELLYNSSLNAWFAISFMY